jgi:hypothetical protein
MNAEEAMDQRLGALLRGADRIPDEAFVARLERRLAAERRMDAQRSAAWRRFGAEAAASAAVAAAFVLIGRAAPGVELEAVGASSLPAAGLLLILWLVVAFRPSAAAAAER